jgi:hypothetical protein
MRRCASLKQFFPTHSLRTEKAVPREPDLQHLRRPGGGRPLKGMCPACAGQEPKAPRSFYYPLFEHMSREHGLTLIDSELADIAAVVAKMKPGGRCPMSNEMPNCPQVDHCHCFPQQEREAQSRGTTHCVCGESEKALRGWIGGRITEPMTHEQREWCLREIESVEGYDRRDYKDATDAQLASSVLTAWMDYCRDKGLL